jgi:hypothetical protein
VKSCKGTGTLLVWLQVRDGGRDNGTGGLSAIGCDNGRDDETKDFSGLGWDGTGACAVLSVT